MITLLLTIHILVAVALVGTVLVQRNEGAVLVSVGRLAVVL